MRKLILLAVGIVSLLASGTAAFADVRTDKDVYTPGETVLISGEGMAAGETVAVAVYFPDGTLAQQNHVAASPSGTFNDSFVLPGIDSPVEGIYTVRATGLSSGHVYASTFYDPLNQANITIKGSGTPCSPNQATFDFGDEVCASVAWVTGSSNPNRTLKIRWYGPGDYPSGPVAREVNSTKASDSSGTHEDKYIPTEAGVWTVTTCQASNTSPFNCTETVNKDLETFTVLPAAEPESHPTSTEVICSPASVVVNETTTCSVTVTDDFGDEDDRTDPEGTVEFSVTGGENTDLSALDCTLVGNGNGSSDCSVTYTPSHASTHVIGASYGGSVDHDESSDSFDLTVNKRDTTTTVECTTPVTVNDTTTCTATVEDTESAGTPENPTGSVSFTTSGAGEFSATSCTLAAEAGNTESSCSVDYEPTSGALSTHVISGDYSGSTVHEISDDDFDLAVEKRETTTAISCVPDVQQVNSNITCTVTVTDVDANGDKSEPAGNVEVFRNGGSIGTCTLASNSDDESSSCNKVVTSTTPTVDTMDASYEGDDVHDTSDSADVLIVFYDPSAGFVTGGGWINSPVGAYKADSSLTGKANFGFVSKYKKGANVPEGSTEFQFKAGDLNFKSTVYEWLVVQGGSSKAQFKGSGTINGSGNYGFMLTVIDGGKSGPDKFRIKIWDKNNGDAVVYDNQGGSDGADPTTTIDSGSIVIHAK